MNASMFYRSKGKNYHVDIQLLLLRFIYRTSMNVVGQHIRLSYNTRARGLPASDRKRTLITVKREYVVYLKLYFVYK